MNIDAKALSMEETEFEKNMEFAQALVFGLSSESDLPPSQNDQSVGPKQEVINPKKNQGTVVRMQASPQSPEIKFRNEGSHPKDPFSLNKIPSISDLENRGATMLMKDEKANDEFQDFPYLYAQAGDLTVSDVEELLNNYKQLVFKYICLSKGMGVSIPPSSSSISLSLVEDNAETRKEPEDTRIAESNDEKHEDLFSSEKVPNFEVEHSENPTETRDEADAFQG